MKVILISLMALLSAFTLADTYKWTDENSKVHFGDKPMNDSAIKISSSKDIPLTQSKAESGHNDSDKATPTTTSVKTKDPYLCTKSVLVESHDQKNGEAIIKRQCLEH
jgi:hypothetical protein